MKLAAVSCSKFQQINPQPVWAEIMAEKPDVLLLLGDTVYLEHDNHSDPVALAKELRALYEAQFAEPNFSKLLSDMRARGARVLSIYDDHDFLGNNRYGGDHDPSLRNAAHAEFVRAFGLPMAAGELYGKYSAGTADILLLDERYFRRSPTHSQFDRDAILGVQQWAWFEKSVAESTAKFLVVASSSTVHTFGDESWEQYPAAFGRIRTLLRDRRGTMVISGDVHRNALYDDSGVMEIVTSGVARNSLLFGAPRKNYGIFTFSDEAVRIELRSLKAGWRFDVKVPLSRWEL